MELIHKHGKLKGNDIRQLYNIQVFNKGLECSVKLEKVITLIAFFCTLDKGCKVD